MNFEYTGTLKKQRPLVNLWQTLLLRHDRGMEKKLDQKGCFCGE